MTSVNTLPIAIALAAALLAPAAAHAQDDRFTVRVGAMHTDADSNLRGVTALNGNTYDYDTGSHNIGTKTVPRLEGTLPFFDRQRLQFNYFQYDETKRYNLADQIDLGNGNPLDITGNARLNSKFELASLAYDYALVETPTTSLGVQLGATYAKVEGKANVNAGDFSYRDNQSADGFAPMVGARFSANTADRKWFFQVQAQYLDADWGNFDDYKGDISRANALVEYRFNPAFGVFAGYDWFKLDVSKSVDASSRLGLDQRFKGPMAGVTFAF